MRPVKPKSTVERARKIRRTLSLPEVLLWQVLRTSPSGHKFRKQHPAGPYVLDFFCAKANLAIEIDGSAHDIGNKPERDMKRDQWLAEHRIDTLRIPASDVLHNTADVADMIVMVVRDRLERFGKAPLSVLQTATSPSQVNEENS